MKARRMKIASDGTAYDVDAAAASRDDRAADRPLWRHPLFLVPVLAVAGYAVVAVALNLLVDADRVREWLAPRASAALNRPVSMGDARVALLPRPSIHVQDVRVDNLENFDGPAIAFIERVRLDIAWLPLLIGRATVSGVHLDAPRVYLAIDESGMSNFGDLAPSPDATRAALTAPVYLGIDRVDVSDASLSYFNAPAARSFTISGAQARATLAPDGAAGWRADIEADSDTLLVRVASLTEEILHLEGPRGTLTARSDGTGRSIDLEGGTLELLGESLALSGRIAGLRGSRPAYDIQLTNDALDAAVVAGAVPAEARSRMLPALDGHLGVTFQVTSARSSGEPPLVRGSVVLRDVGVRVSGRAMVDRLHGTVGVAPDTIHLESLAGTFADGPFELSGTVARDTRAVALQAHARPDLDALDRLGLLPEETTLSGDADLDLSVTGMLTALDSLEVVGTAVLEGLQAKHARLGVPLYVPAGELALAGGEVTWTELPVLLGQDEMVTSGRLGGVVFSNREAGAVPELEMSLRGALDLGALLTRAEPSPDATYGHIAFAHLGGRQVGGRPAETVAADLGLSRPRSLPVRGTVTLELDALDFHRYHLDSLSARIELSDSVLVVDVPSFQLWGGTAAANLRLGIGELREEPFAFTLSADSASAEEMLSAWTPLGSAVSGTLALELEVAGPMDGDLLPVGRDLAGHVSLSITDGHVRDTGPNLVIADFLGSPEWTDVSFATWDTDADISSRRLEVRSSELSGEQGSVTLSGLIHLDGSHDLSVGLSIPPDRLSAVSLRRTGIGQSVLEQLSANGSSLDLGLRMSGVLATPQLEPDASNARAVSP